MERVTRLVLVFIIFFVIFCSNTLSSLDYTKFCVRAELVESTKTKNVDFGILASEPVRVGGGGKSHRTYFVYRVPSTQL